MSPRHDNPIYRIHTRNNDVTVDYDVIVLYTQRRIVLQNAAFTYVYVPTGSVTLYKETWFYYTDKLAPCDLSVHRHIPHYCVWVPLAVCARWYTIIVFDAKYVQKYATLREVGYRHYSVSRDLYEPAFISIEASIKFNISWKNNKYTNIRLYNSDYHKETRVFQILVAILSNIICFWSLV